MITPARREDRQLVPRWRHSSQTILSGEADSLALGPIARPWEEHPDLLRKRSALFTANPSIATAVEVVGAALLLDEAEEGLAAAQYIRELAAEDHETFARPLALANRLFSDLDGTPTLSFPMPGLPGLRLDARETVRRSRRLVAGYERDPLAWLDMAHAHMTLGHHDAARKEMLVALGLAPDSRTVVRAAVQLFVHIEEPERAHHIIQKTSNLSRDPWLLAAELAVASQAGRTPGRVRDARRVIEADSVPPFHSAEVASALATLELGAGSDRRARQLFRRSLIDPTENAVAQAEWAAHRTQLDELESRHLDVAWAYEARARHHAAQGLWDPAVQESQSWLQYLPFSRGAAIFGSYYASVGQGDHRLASEIAREGLVANPSDQLLRNNLVFALVNLGKLGEATAEFEKIGAPRDLPANPALLATAGLLAFRHGEADLGRELYVKAIHESRDDRRARALAALYLAREELLAASDGADAAVERAVDLARGLPYPELAQSLRTELNRTPG